MTAESGDSALDETWAENAVQSQQGENGGQRMAANNKEPVGLLKRRRERVRVPGGR